MPWTVTLEIVNCDSPSTKLAGVSIFDGSSTYATDADGKLVYIVADNYESVIVKISKTDFITKNYSVRKQDDGTIQTICLDPSPIPPGHDPNVPTGEGQEFGNGCFIISATTGSPDSVEVNSLRSLRDRISAVSGLSARLIDVIYGEYFQFSPGIASELQQDALTRQIVLQMVVRPLLAWYTLGGVLGLQPADEQAIARAKQEALEACPPYLPGASILAWLEAIRAGEALPADAHPILRDLAPRITGLQFAAWAILDPLIRVWRSAIFHLDLTGEVAQWLATAPLDALAPERDAEILEQDLGTLAGFLAFSPAARQRLGQRLLAAWPEAAGSLRSTGFVTDQPQITSNN